MMGSFYAGTIGEIEIDDEPHDGLVEITTTAQCGGSIFLAEDDIRAMIRHMQRLLELFNEDGGVSK